MVKETACDKCKKQNICNTLDRKRGDACKDFKEKEKTKNA